MASSTSLLRGCSTARVARTKPGLACAGIPHQCRSSSSFTGRRCNHVPRHGTLAPKASSRLSRGAPARAASEQAAGPSQEEAARRKAEMNEETIRMLSFMPDSHYAFLGVTPWAPADEVCFKKPHCRKGIAVRAIKTTYRRLSKQYHPDTTKIQDKREAARLFNKLQNAYQTLSDDQRRATYDLSLQVGALYSNRTWRLRAGTPMYAYMTVSCAADQGTEEGGPLSD
eukprot:scaffold111_cov404-Prasinococcus_capsulatus_cf.AAC.2